LTGQEDGTVRLWDLETGQETRRFIAHADGAPPRYWVYSVAFSPDGKSALAGAGEQVSVWDIDTGQEVRRLEGGGWVYCVSPNGEQVVTDFRPSARSADGGKQSLALRELAAGKVIRRFEGGRDAAFSPDGRQLLAVSGDGVRCWDLDTGHELHHWAIRTGIQRVAFVPGAKQAVAIDDQGDVHFWDTDRGGVVRTLRGPAARTLFGTEPGDCRAAIFAEGRRAAVLYTHFQFVGGDSFRLYDLEHGELIYAGDLPTERGVLLAGTPDGRRLLSSTPYKLDLWSLPGTDGK
jgi:WD40 repeat protein